MGNRNFSTKYILAVAALSISLTGLAYGESAQVVDLNNAGVKALNSGNFQLAIQKLEQALKMDANYQLARENLAIAYNNYGLQLQNNPSEAIKQFHKALFYNPSNATTQSNLEGIIRYLGKDPHSVKDRLALGNEARKNLDFEGAMVEFQAALQLKDDPAVHMALGDVYRVRDMNDKAINEYKAASKLADSAELEVKLGQAYQAKQDLPNAIASYGRAIELKSDDPDVLDALKAGWEEALKESPLAPENHIGLGQALQYMGDFDQARAEYIQALRLDRNNQVAQRLLSQLDQAKKDSAIKKHINAGVDLQTRKLYDQAIDEYKQALQADPNNAVAWVNLGSAYQQKESYQEAIDAYNKALRYDANNIAAQQGIKAALAGKQDKDIQDAGKQALNLFQLGKYDEAIAKYQDVLKINPQDASTHFSLGATYQAKKDYDLAIAEYRQALSLDPKNTDYQKALQTAYQAKADPIIAQAEDKHRQKDYSQAIDLYQQALTLLPKNAGLWYNLAGAYYAREDYARARDTYQKAYELDSKGQVNDLYLMAVIDEHFGNGQKALDGYKNYLSQAANIGQYNTQAQARVKALTANIKDTMHIKSEAEIASIKDAEDNFQKALTLQQQKQFDAAIPLYQKAINLQPQNANYVYGLGTLFQDKGNMDLAINWYKQAIGLDPKNQDYPKVLQQAYILKAAPLADQAVKKQTSGDIQGAIELYGQALEILPGDAGLWTNLGTAYQNSDAFSDARQAYQKAYNLDPKVQVGDLYLMASIDENFGQGNLALQEYKKYLAAAPTGQYASDSNLRVAALTKNINDTKKLLTSSEIKNERQAGDVFDQAVKLQQVGKYDEALPLYAQAVQLVPKEPSYNYALATDYQAKGDYDNAMLWYKNAIALDPKNKDYQKLLSQVLDLKAAPIMDAAVKKHTSGDAAGAIPLYEQALAIVPNNARGWTNLAAAYQATDNFAKARQVYEQAYNLDPKGEAENLYYMAAIDENYGQGAKALQEYQKYVSLQGLHQYLDPAKQRIAALSKNVGNTQKLQTQSDIASAQQAADAYDQGVKHQQSNQFDDAIASYQKAISLQPNNAMYVYAIGTAYQAKGDMDNAIASYQKASALDPKNQDYKKLLGAAYDLKAAPLMDEAVKKHGAGDLAGAIPLYQQALAISPNNARGWTNLASAYQATDDYSHARDAFQKALSVDPRGEAEDWYFIGAIDENYGQGAKALQDYQKYVSALPTGSYVALAQARIRALSANSSAVQRMVTQADQQKNSDADAAFQAAVKFQQDNKLDDAIDSYKKALAISPNNASYWYSLGTAYQNKGDLDNALSSYLKATSLNPQEPSYKQYIKQVRQAKAGPLLDSAFKKQTTKDDKGNYDLAGAIADYEAALRIDDDPTTHLNLGTAYQANNNLLKAVSEYKRAIQLDPKQCDAYYYLGTTYQAMNQPSLAIAEYRHCIQCAPTGQNAASARQQIKALGGR